MKCPVLGWTIANPQTTAIPSLADQLRMEEGLAVHKRAVCLFKNGILIPFSKTTSAAKKTQAALNDTSIKSIFEATFIADGFVTKADIIERNRFALTMYEVKSSVNDDEKFIDDMAYTAMVAQRAGLKITKCILLLISKDFRLGMSNDKLFVSYDHTNEVLGRAEEFASMSDDIQKIVSQRKSPAAELTWNCKGCELFEGCVGKGCEHHIFDLPRISQPKFNELKDMGITSILDIPVSFALTENQLMVRSAVQSGSPVIRKTLKTALSTIKFPAYYLDFETIQTVIPLYPEVAPYTQIPTQYSIHVCSGVGKVQEHFEFLADHQKDDRRSLAEKLIKGCGTKGSIVSYSPFEKTTINGLINTFPDLAKKLQALVDRIIDLNAIIAKHYYHPEFHGSTSIKVTLPVLVPGMSYKGLSIADGSNAMAAFAYMAMGKYDCDQIAKIRKDLLKYCAQDTMAMVKLNQCLFNLSK